MDWENIPYFIRRQFLNTSKKIQYILIGSFLFIYAVLIYYQVIRGGYYYNLSEKNRLRMFVINAPRGVIYDFNNEVIADNRPSINVYYYPVKAPSDQEINLILNLFPSVKDKIYYALKTGKIIQLYTDLEREKLFYLYSLKHRISNIFISTEFKRKYPYQNLFSHLIGYVGRISYDEYLSVKHKGYLYEDLIGKSGIEKFYEDHLRGINGVLLMEVDAKGNPTKILKNVPPEPGNNIYTTVDLDLQKVARNALIKTGHNGAIVGIDPRDGAIRIFVSFKDFDPNMFINKRQIESEIFNDPNLPLFNRITQGVYPAGSTFKILTTIAALNSGKHSQDIEYFCPGSFKLGEKIFKCWEKKGHGKVDLYNAIKLSCNVYFINLGLKIGIDEIEKYAKMFHFGQKVGIDLPYESTGIVPSKKWKKEKTKTDWYEGDTASVSIGQGYLSVTPLQLALFASIIANKGEVYLPYIVSKIVDHEGNILYVHTPVKKEIKEIKPEIWDFIHKAMKSVVDSGTGIAAKIPGCDLAGKTGTAQNPHGKDHAWFICFGPLEEGKTPELALAILVEHGGTGGGVAAPIAREIFKCYLEKSKKIKMDLPSQQIIKAEEYGD